jgi:hypothetical protein
MLSTKVTTTIAARAALAIAGALSVLTLIVPGIALAANLTDPQTEGQQFSGVVGSCHGWNDRRPAVAHGEAVRIVY